MSHSPPWVASEEAPHINSEAATCAVECWPPAGARWSHPVNDGYALCHWQNY